MARHTDNMLTAIKQRRPFYYIDSVEVKDDRVEVAYQEVGPVVDEWYEGSINIEKLQDFIVEEKMNEYCQDWADHNGEHQQRTGITPMEYLMDDYDFLREVAKDYLEAGKEVEL